MVKKCILITLSMLAGIAFAQQGSPVNESYTLTTSETIKPFEASYVVRKMGMKAEIKTSVRVDGEHYIYTKKTKPKGMAKMFLKEANETSIFSHQGSKLGLIAYTYAMQSKDDSRDEKFLYDATQQQVVGNSRGTDFSLAVEDNLMDRASMEIALMMDASKRADLDYRVVDRGRVKDYKFNYEGQQSIKAAGEKYTCDMYKVSRSSGKRSTSMCLAEALGFLPVMVIHDENGTELKMLLTKQNLQ